MILVLVCRKGHRASFRGKLPPCVSLNLPAVTPALIVPGPSGTSYGRSEPPPPGGGDIRHRPPERLLPQADHGLQGVRGQGDRPPRVKPSTDTPRRSGPAARAYLAPHQHRPEHNLEPVKEVVANDDHSCSARGPAFAGTDGLDARGGCSHKTENADLRAWPTAAAALPTSSHAGRGAARGGRSSGWARKGRSQLSMLMWLKQTLKCFIKQRPSHGILVSKKKKMA